LRQKGDKTNYKKSSEDLKQIKQDLAKNNFQMLNFNRFSELNQLLKNHKFKEADRETAKIMLTLSNRLEEQWIDEISLKSIDCEQLELIDRMWNYYSNGKFGFSVQNNIYYSLKIGINDKLIKRNFGNNIRWLENNQWLTTDNLIDNINAPNGHFPSVSREGSLDSGWLVRYILNPSVVNNSLCLK